MSIEVTCGQCQGRLLVEQENTIVKCPHCGVALQIGAPSSSVLSESVVVSNPPTDSKSPTEIRSTTEEVAAENAEFPIGFPADDPGVESSFLAPPIIVDAPLPENDMPEADAEPIASAIPVAEPDSSDPFGSLSKLSSLNQPQTNIPHFVTEPEADTAAETNEELPAPVEADAAEEEAVETDTAESDKSETTTPELVVAPGFNGSRRGSSKSRGLLLAYASAVTFALLYYLLTSRTNQLESLPDIEPPLSVDEKVIFNIVPEAATLPAGHMLQLGESQRFGDVVVTPVKVTRGPLAFTHYDSEQKNVKPKSPTKDVLKLWLKFKNVSTNLPVKPLGRQLTFKRGLTNKGETHLRANQFVCQLTEKKRDGHLFFLYDLPIDDVWDIKDQQIERSLKPGETFETYLPTEAVNLTSLTGDLIWRTHIRKGHNSETLRGVTTLLEVRFHSDEIVDEI